MSTKNRSAVARRQEVDRHREETEWTLNAIAGAISAGRLPPDDAFAWARIAAREAGPLAAALASGARGDWLDVLSD